ncbi:MAG: CHC2 zinc finger domain-containing protein, partial [Bacteroidota bacterium]
MTIAQIKARLSIREVLSHYGLEVNKNGMVNCPFHSDRKSSMKVYDETNTVYCFAGGCGVSYLDVIDFIMKVEKSSKRAAIVKAKELIGFIGGLPTLSDTKRKKEKLITATYPVSKEDYASSPEGSPTPIDFSIYRKSLERSKSAQEYCGSRGLDWSVQEIGYQSRKSVERWGRGCIIFPLRNDRGEVVSLYGRSIFSKGHYYQSDRSGLYPSYPPSQTRTLVLCESVIDAASLERVRLDLSSYSVLALYGTNGLTEEHLAAIKGLGYLEELVFALDGDDAGAKAMKGYSDSLAQLLPEVVHSTVSVPPGEDLNSLIVAHDNYQGLMKQLFSARECLYRPRPTAKRGLDTSDPHNLIYVGAQARYYVKGGIRHSVKDLDALKVTLVGENKMGRKSRHKLDLYEDKQVEKVSRYMGEKLGLRSDLIELDIQGLTDELEVYQRRLYESSKSSSDSEKEEVYEMSEAERTAALSFLRSENLLAQINEGIGSCGIVGEEKTRLLLFIVASSYQMRHTLHALIQGSSGSGKTRLLQVIRSLMPEEVVKSYTRVTDGSFYNQ